MTSEAPHYLLVVILSLLFSFARAEELHSEAQIRQNMVDLSRQLGVTCVYCHQMENFKDGAKEAFKIARAHLKIVADLNSQRIRGLPKVDCYMCHQGHAKAPFKEPLDPTKAAPASH